MLLFDACIQNRTLQTRRKTTRSVLEGSLVTARDASRPRKATNRPLPRKADDAGVACSPDLLSASLTRAVDLTGSRCAFEILKFITYAEWRMIKRRSRSVPDALGKNSFHGRVFNCCCSKEAIDPRSSWRVPME